MASPVAIVGLAQTEFKHYYTDTILPDLVRRAAVAALAEAHLHFTDIDAVVCAMAPDALIGVMHAERWVVDAAAAVGKPLLRVNTGGATGLSALQAGYQHVASGLFETVLVIGAERVGESGDAQTLLNKIWDPVYERRLPLNTITMLAMQAVRFFEKYGATEVDMARVAVKNRRNGTRNQYAHLRNEVTLEEVLQSRMVSYPIKLYDACPQSSGAAAVVLSRGELVERYTDRPAWIRGLGCSTGTYWMGDRVGPKALSDYAEAPAMQIAVEAAYAQAGVTAADIDVAELYAPFSCVELHAIEDAGLCERGSVTARLADGYFDLGGAIPVNPSGGVMCANPIAVTGLVRAIECALQVTNRAGEHQVKSANLGLATSIGGAHQFFTAMVIGSEPGARYQKGVL